MAASQTMLSKVPSGISVRISAQRYSTFGARKFVLACAIASGSKSTDTTLAARFEKKWCAKNPPPQQRSRTLHPFFIGIMLKTPRSHDIGLRDTGQSQY